MGLATGILFVHPVAAFFGATSITWDAQSCPAGIYTITALARTQSTTKTYAVTTRDVSLPKTSVVQEFPDLPPGTYQVSATVIGNNGRAFESETQTVNGLGSGKISGSGGATTQGTILGRNTAPTRTAAGSAKPRNTPEPPPRPPNDPRLSPPVDGSATRSAMTVLGQSARRTIDDLALDPIVQRFLVRLEMASGPDASDQTWRRVVVVDTDGDGTLDIVTIESVTGETWVFQIVR